MIDNKNLNKYFDFKYFDNSNIINELNYKEFETLVISLINYKLKKENKSLIKYVQEEILFKDGKKSFIEFDAVAPEGIEDLSGPTIIEFKRTHSKSSIDFLTNSFQFYPKYKSILMVFGSILTKEEKYFLNNDNLILPPEFQIKIWDLEDITGLVLDDKEKIFEIFENINKEILNSTVEKAASISNWEEESDLLINEVNQAFKNDDVVFFLGAGVSKDAGLPSWDELLRSLNVSIIESKIHFKLSEKQKDEILSLLTELQSGTPLVTASYIRKALDSEFLKEIHKALYKGVKKITEQKQLDAIAKASRPLIGKLGIKGIITYNFDDLLEQHLERRNIDYKSIYREGDFEIPTKRPIYHVHGFVPRKSENYSQLDKGVLVFAEDGYHTLQNDPYSWSNLVQLKALRESTCVLVGLSGIDPNLRRLFSNFSQRFDGCKHYILLQRQLNKIQSSLTEKKFNTFSNLHHKLQEGVFKELGLKVIWYKDHTDLPDIISKISDCS
jgi:hypothetical protein